MKKETNNMFYKAILLLGLFSLSESYATQNMNWKFLEKNEFIDVVAPGYGAKDGSMEKARENIQRLGFQARIPDDFIDPQPLGYSNTEKYRADHLKSVLGSEDSKVLWALRGGRGSSPLLAYLKDLAPSQPKLIIGYSDITALHLWASKRKWPSLHGVVLGCNKDAGHIVNSETLLEEVANIITGETKEVSYKLIPLNKTAKRQGIDIHSSVVGGNLSVIQRSIGTETSLDARGKILFLEDVGEAATRGYEIFSHLDRAGIFEGIECLFLGNFTTSLQQQEVENYKLLTEKINDLLDSRNIPVISSDKFGHGPYNYPLPLNTSAILRFDNSDETILHIKTNN